MLSFLILFAWYPSNGNASLKSGINDSKNEQQIIKREKPNVTQNYIVGFKNTVDEKEKKKNKGLEHRNFKKLYQSNIFSVLLNDKEMNELKNDSDVMFIEPDISIKLASIGKEEKKKVSIQETPWGIKSIGANLTLDKKIDGKKVKVAVLDTGIADHPDINVSGGVSFVGNTSYKDEHGHGTCCWNDCWIK
jgi:subtilisin family serine protease